MPIVNIPGVGDVVLVDREQLRFTTHGRQASIPRHLRAMLANIPPNPAVFDWSKGETIKFPTLGNDRYGDCYLVDILHWIQAMTGNATGTQSQFDLQAVIQKYLQMSPGDNGLDDGQIFPAWKSGLFGHKILDEMTINPADTATMALCMWGWCGLSWTCALPKGWANNARPGATWGPNSGPPVGGHAMYQSGCNFKGGYDARTWGISPPINVTHAGLMSADPEVVVAFSLDMFNVNGVAPCGASYDQLAALWVQLGGKHLPPNPFPPAQPLDWWA